MIRSQSPCFLVNGYPITAAQRDAGLGVMVGTFSRNAVTTALEKAGVINPPGKIRTVGRATDRLLRSAREQGKIRVAVGKGLGMWECVR